MRNRQTVPQLKKTGIDAPKALTLTLSQRERGRVAKNARNANRARLAKAAPGGVPFRPGTEVNLVGQSRRDGEAAEAHVGRGAPEGLAIPVHVVGHKGAGDIEPVLQL